MRGVLVLANIVLSVLFLYVAVYGIYTERDKKASVMMLVVSVINAFNVCYLLGA